MLPLEKASYRVRAVAADIGFNPDNGNKQVSITGRVVDHDALNGEEITAVLHFSPKAQERSIESLLNFGFPIDDITQLADADEAKCAELLPDVAEFQCAPEEWDGKWSLKVQWVNKPGRGKFAFKNKLEGGDLKAFGSELKNALKNARGGAPRKPAQNGSAPTHPNDPRNKDDGIPF